jgi:glycosyltransferase involved in cell wall biosynthesis
MVVHRIQPFLLDSPKLIRFAFLPPIAFLQLTWLRLKHGRLIIHAHSTGLYGYLVSLFSTIFRTPLVKDVQDLSVPGWSLRTGNVKMYIGTGKAVEEQLKDIGIPEDRMIIHPALNPPDIEELAASIKRKPGNDGMVRLAFIAALRPYKAPDIVIRAFEKVQKERDDICLDIIGTGSEEEWVRRYIESHSIRNVKMHGTFEDYGKVLEFMANSDIMLLPSRLGGESWGRVTCEAYIFEKPVIATDIPAIKNVVTDGYNGILIDVDDVDALAREIVRLADDKELRTRLGYNGKKWLGTLPSWQDIGDDIYGVYEEIWKGMG